MLAQKFEKIVCDVDSRHGAFDFICVEPRSSCGALVCMDCLKKTPEQFQKYAKSFLRIKDFLELISKPPMSASKISQLQSIKKHESRYKHLLGNYDRYIVNEIKHIKDFFDTV